jgi:YD repeat-containing protein
MRKTSSKKKWAVSMIRLLLYLTLAAGCLVADQLKTMYSYDDAGRLVRVDYGNGMSIQYAYDSAGNMVNQSVQSSPTNTRAKAKPTTNPRGAVVSRDTRPNEKARANEQLAGSGANRP